MPGGIVGVLYDSEAYNIHAEGSIIATFDMVGGLIGCRGFGGILDGGSFSGEVKGPAYVGGLIGALARRLDGYTHIYLDVTNSWAEGTVIATSHSAGGFIGYINGFDSTILRATNSYTTAEVTAPTRVGGFIGWQNTASSATLRNVYAAGNVTETGANKKS
jgi:hypothetical protein